MSTVSASPWAVTAPTCRADLTTIMSEELAEMSARKENTEKLDFVYNEEDFMTPEELVAKRHAEEVASLKLAEELASATQTPATEEFVFNEDDFLTAEEKADRDFALALAAQEEEEVLMREKNAPKRGNSKVNVCSSLDEHYMYGSGDGASHHVQVSSESFAAEELGAKLSGQDGSGGISFKNGVANVDGTRVSKHDGLIDGLMNSMSLNELDGSGDMSGLMVSNTVSNSLKSFSQKQKQKGVYVGGGRVSSKDSRSTSEAVLDETTRLLLFKMIQKNIFDEVHGVIKTGKESNVYHATKNKTNPEMSPPIAEPNVTDKGYVLIQGSGSNCDSQDIVSTEVEVNLDNEGDTDSVIDSVASSQSHFLFENSDLDYHDVAVKVFKTTLNEFHNRIDYIKGDHRFSREKYAKNSNNKRKFIAQWVEKEFRNLCRARAKGLNVPRPILFKANVLIMEMIVEDKIENGNDGKFVNSPQLKEVNSLPLEQWDNCYKQTLHLVKDLYQKCRLVHADLSEYNLLLHNREHVYVLDFGQALDTSHPEHKDYMLRDLKIVNVFFGKKGVRIRDPQKVLDSIVQGDSASWDVLELNLSLGEDNEREKNENSSTGCALADSTGTVTESITFTSEEKSK